MVARLPLSVRVGLLLISIGIAAYGSWTYWAATRIWVPLYVPISLSKGHIRTAQFKINVKSTYSIEIEVDREFDFEGVPCLIGYHQCENNPAVLNASWSLSNGERVLAHGKSDVDRGSMWGSKTMGRVLGAFNAGKGQYVLDLDVLQDGSRLNAGTPHLVVFEAGYWRWNTVDQEAGFFLVSLLLAAAGTYLILRSAMMRRRERLNGFATACSLTQPGPQSRDLQVDAQPSAIHSVTAGWHYQRKLRPSNERTFSGLSSYGLIAAITYTLLFLIIWVIQSMDQPMPIGLKLHLWRSGAPALTSPWIEPLRVRLKSAGLIVRPSLYVNSRLVRWEDLGYVLEKELRRRPPNFPVYLEGDPNMDWGYAVNAIDIIRGMHAEVVLLTPARE